jgi:hypothetical protein
MGTGGRQRLKTIRHGPKFATIESVMSSCKCLIAALILWAGNHAFAADVFPQFVKNKLSFTVPRNTPGCVSDPGSLVGTNYVYQLNGQVFANSVSGHIQSLADGFSGKSDGGSPWKTLTELLAVYQRGSGETQIRSLYTKSSSEFLNQVYGDAEVKARFQEMGRTISGMQAVMGYDYGGIYMAQVKLQFKGGHQEMTQFCFALDGGRYKLIALPMQKLGPALMNIGSFLNWKLH